MTAPKNSTLTFADEFNVLSLSNGSTATANWYTQQAWGGGFGDADFKAAGGVSSPFSIVSKGGATGLQIEMTRTASGGLQSGLISNVFPDGTSKTPLSGDPFGYYETRMWLPDGQGVWPAFWAIERERLSPTRDHVYELDIMEQHGSDLGDRYAANVHDWNWDNGKLASHSNVYQHNVVGTGVLTTGWHTYGLEVRPEQTTFYMDDRAFFSIATPAALTSDLIFMFDLAAGGGWRIDPALDHAKLLIDYFRVYELDAVSTPPQVTLQGTSGNDTFNVSTTDTLIRESVGGGFDTARSTVSFTLSDNVEKLVLTGASPLNGTGNAGDNQLYAAVGGGTLSGLGGADTLYGAGGVDALVGGAGDDKLYGAAGNDTLDGGAGRDRLDGGLGADVMSGGADADVYFVDNLGDRVIEAKDGGVDMVSASVSFSLAGQYVEQLALAGVSDINATGNELANVIVGNGKNNVIDGGDGGDRLTGGAGADIFVFSKVGGPANVDVIVDFSAADDTIRLSREAFPWLAPGALTPSMFYAGSSAHDADDRIIYNAKTGGLFFDRDGAGGAYGAVQFATVQNHAALTSADFTVI